MADPLSALKKATAVQSAPPASMEPVRRGIDAAMDGLRGLFGVGDQGPAGPTVTNFGAMLGAGLPILKGLKGFQFWHDIPDLERIASGSGPIRVYHGTTADAAANIARSGIQLPASGEEAAHAMAARYNIPYVQWKKEIPWSGYDDETKRLSTAPYPIAARWAQHFPQGEINSQLNAQARVLAYARQKGIPYGQAYEDIYTLAKKRGVQNMYDAPTAAGLPNRMMPQQLGGTVLGIDVDARALRPHDVRDAEYLLRSVKKGNVIPLDALKEWNRTYRDMKIAPQNIQGIEPVSQFPRRK